MATVHTDDTTGVRFWGDNSFITKVGEPWLGRVPQSLSGQATLVEKGFLIHTLGFITLTFAPVPARAPLPPPHVYKDTCQPTSHTCGHCPSAIQLPCSLRGGRQPPLVPPCKHAP